jgi:hypothetical protein
MEHNGCQIRLSSSGLDWMPFVAMPRQRPALIMAPHREAALAKAHEWIEAQLAAARDSA